MGELCLHISITAPDAVERIRALCKHTDKRDYLATMAKNFPGRFVGDFFEDGDAFKVYFALGSSTGFTGVIANCVIEPTGSGSKIVVSLKWNAGIPIKALTVSGGAAGALAFLLGKVELAVGCSAVFVFAGFHWFKGVSDRRLLIRTITELFDDVTKTVACRT